MKQRHSPWTINQKNQQTRNMVQVWILRALTYHLKGMPYKVFLPRHKKSIGNGYFSTRGKEGSRIFIRRIREKFFLPEELLMNDESDKEWWDCITALGVLVRKWLGGACNLMRNDRTGSQRLAYRFENVLEGKLIWWKYCTGSQHLVCWFQNGLEGRAWQAWSFGLARWGQGSADGSAVEGRRSERERHYLFLRGCNWREAVACKGVECLCQISRIIKIGCTQLWTNK